MENYRQEVLNDRFRFMVAFLVHVENVLTVIRIRRHAQSTRKLAQCFYRDLYRRFVYANEFENVLNWHAPRSLMVGSF